MHRHLTINRKVVIFRVCYTHTMEYYTAIKQGKKNNKEALYVLIWDNLHYMSKKVDQKPK